MNPKDYKSYTAASVIKPYQIVKVTVRKKVAACAAATDACLGVSQELGAKANERVDIAHGGLPDIKLGAAVDAPGKALTSNADGFAIPATADGQRIIGFALSAGASGDVIPFFLAPGFLATAG